MIAIIFFFFLYKIISIVFGYIQIKNLIRNCFIELEHFSYFGVVFVTILFIRMLVIFGSSRVYLRVAGRQRI